MRESIIELREAPHPEPPACGLVRTRLFWALAAQQRLPSSVCQQRLPSTQQRRYSALYAARVPASLRRVSLPVPPNLYRIEGALRYATEQVHTTINFAWECVARCVVCRQMCLSTSRRLEDRSREVVKSSRRLLLGLSGTAKRSRCSHGSDVGGRRGGGSQLGSVVSILVQRVIISHR